MKLQLPSVTLICIDCINVTRAINALEICKSKCDFGAVKLLTDLPTDYEHKIEIIPLKTLTAYSIFMLTKFPSYVDTEHVLVVQRDGFILNADAWKDDWLKYDYIAPLFVQYNLVGSGGFSLRSKKLIDAVTKVMPTWDGTQQHADEIQDFFGYYEDGVISFRFHEKFNFAPLEEAADFAAGGNPNLEYYRPFPFAFHGARQNVNHKTGFVFPTCHHTEGECLCVQSQLNYLTKMETLKYSNGSLS